MVTDMAAGAMTRDHTPSGVRRNRSAWRTVRTERSVSDDPVAFRPRPGSRRPSRASDGTADRLPSNYLRESRLSMRWSQWYGVVIDENGWTIAALEP